MHHGVFFKKKGPFSLREILDYCEIKPTNDYDLKKKIFDISTLENLKENCITSYRRIFSYFNIFTN